MFVALPGPLFQSVTTQVTESSTSYGPVEVTTFVTLRSVNNPCSSAAHAIPIVKIRESRTAPIHIVKNLVM
jgi:hypothetical protein